jgi:GGDEF domain-containing protein
MIRARFTLKNQAKKIKTASCDPLTGLHNRNAFFDHATQAIELAARNKNIAAILFICIDRLKVIKFSIPHSLCCGETMNPLLKRGFGGL